MENKKVELNGKTFIIRKMPATVAYEVALMYFSALETKKMDEMQKCLYKMFEYVDVDLKDGRKVALETPEIINQHLTGAGDLVKLQKEVVEVNFGFFPKEKASRS